MTAAQERDEVLRLDGLVMHFGPVRAVDGVDLTVHRGEVVALVGESGSGKSTVGRCIVRLTEPTDGTVTLAGTDVTHLGRRALRDVRRDVSIVFQDPAGSLDPRMLVGDVVAEPLRLQKVGRDERRRRVDEVLGKVGLRREVAGRYPHELSGGQRQRVSLARALVSTPALLVADEPTSALDVSVQASVLNLLADLQRDLGFACLFITHDLSAVEYLADSVAVMYLGQVVEHGTREQVFARPSHRTRSRCWRPRRSPTRSCSGPGRGSSSAMTCRRPSTRRRAAASTPAAPSRSSAARATCRCCATSVGTRSPATSSATTAHPRTSPPTSAPAPPVASPRSPRGPHDLHDATDPRGHLRDGVLHPLGRLAVGDAAARARRQRLRRGRVRGLRPARRRAAPQRPRRRHAGHRRDRRRPDAARAVRPGAGPGRRHRRALPRRGARARARLRSAGGDDPGRRRRVAAHAARPGTRTLREVLEPAIGYARHGVPLVERVGATVASVQRLFEEDWTTSAALWLPGGRPPAAGELFRNPEWADTLERLVAEGEAAGSDRAAQVEGARRRGRRASSPRRWTRSRDCPSATPRASGTAGSSRPTTSPAGRRPGSRRRPSSGTATPSPRPVPGARGRRCCRSCSCSTRSATRLSSTCSTPVTCTGCSSASSWPRPTARRGTARGPSRWTSCCRPPTRASGPRWSATAPTSGCARAAPPVGRRGCPPTSCARATPTAGTRTATRRPVSRPWRGRARRAATPVTSTSSTPRQHGLGDPERRLAAVLPDDPRARLRPRQPDADVLARGGAGLDARAGQAPAHDADADAGAARRGAVPRLREPGRGSAGPVAAALPDPDAAAGAVAPGGDRRARLALHRVPGKLLPAHAGAGRRRRRGPGRPGRRRGLEERGHVVTVADGWSQGRLCAVSRGADGILRGAANPRGCRGTPSGAEPPERRQTWWGSTAARAAASTWLRAASSAPSASPAAMASTSRMCSRHECGARTSAPSRKTHCTCR